MSFLSSVSQSSSTEKLVNRDEPDPSLTPALDNLERDSSSHSRSDPDLQTPPTGSAIRSVSHQPSEATESTMWATFIDDRAFDNESSVTAQDEVLWHEVDVKKYAHTIPPMIVPGLLQGIGDVSPSRCSLDREGGVFHEADEESGDSGGDEAQYSAAEIWKTQMEGDDVHTNGWVRTPSPDFQFETPYNTVEQWVEGTRPMLQDYADRQLSLPLGPRLDVTLHEPYEFILGAIKLLANRDQQGCADPSRQLGPLDLENFVNLDRWAKEYFRSRHAIQCVEDGVSTLLTIVLNNFYEGQVQLIDRLVEFALRNMHSSGRSSLSIADFAFGFDFRMSQDPAFSVETSSRIRKANLFPAAVPPVASEPVVTHSGRQVKPTERAQAASKQAQNNPKGRRNKGENSSQPKDVEKDNSVPCTKKGSTQPSYERTAKATPKPSHDAETPAPTKTSERTKHRPIRPSNLGSNPPISPTSGTTPSLLEDSSESEHSNSTSAKGPKVSGSNESPPTVHQTPRLSIKIPATRLRTSSVPASDSEPRLDRTSGSTPQSPPLVGTGEATTHGTPDSEVARPRGRENRRGRKRGNAPLTPSAGGSTACLHAIDNSTGTSDNASQNTQKVGTDPGHLQGKKRKLDDCDD